MTTGVYNMSSQSSKCQKEEQGHLLLIQMELLAEN